MPPRKSREKAFYCTVCKKICVDGGRWIEREKGCDPEKDPATFCLSLCPDCSRKIYPKFYHVT